MADIADRLDAAADRFAQGVLDLPDLDARAGSLDWSVGQVAGHVAAGMRAYASMVAGEPTPLDRISRREELAVQLLASVEGLAPAELAAMVRDGVARVAQEVRKAGDGPLPFYEHELPAPALAGIALAELLVHGHDIGVPVVDDVAAAAAVLAVPHVLPFVVKPGAAPARASLAFRARGHGEAVVDVDERAARVRAPGERGPVDARLSGRPVDLLLVAYQRRGPAGPMLRGRLAVTGRRPWRLQALETRFETA